MVKHLGLAGLHELIYPREHEEKEKYFHEVDGAKREISHQLNAFYIPQVKHNSYSMKLGLKPINDPCDIIYKFLTYYFLIGAER